MAREGWLSVRDLPGTGTKNIKEVFDYLKQNFDLCEDCEGVGHIVNDHQTVYDGVSTLRLSDSKMLTEMKDNGTLTKEVLSRIVETLVHGRETCSECNGFGFVKKLRKKIGEDFTL